VKAASLSFSFNKGEKGCLFSFGMSPVFYFRAYRAATHFITNNGMYQKEA